MPLPREILYDPEQMKLPPEQRIGRLAQADPGEFGKLSRDQQMRVLQIADEKYKAKHGSSSQPQPPKDSFLGGIGKDLSIGFRSGLSEAAHTASNVEKALGLERAAQREEGFSKRMAPTQEEQSSRGGFFSHLTQAAGSAPIAILEYAPAQMAGKYAPLVAGAIGAASKLDKGPKDAIKEGIKQAVMFGGAGMAEKLPTRTERAIGSGVAMAAPAAVESGGDVTKTAQAGLMGAAFGAVGRGKVAGITPTQAKKALQGGIEAAGELSDSIRSTLAPQTRAYTAAKTARAIRSQLGELNQSTDIADFALDEARGFYDKLPEAERVKSIVDIQRGRPQSHPDPKIQPSLQKFAGTMRGLLDDKIDEFLQVTSRFNQATGKMEPTVLKDLAAVRANPNANIARRDFYLNYFPQIWKDPDKAADFIKNWMAGKRPLGGPKTFLKQREYLDMEEAMLQAGLEPVSTNPVDLLLLKRREVDRAILSHRVIQEMSQENLLRFIPANQHGPKGWVQVRGKEFTRSARAQNGQLIIKGNYWAPEPAARVLNNYLSPGLRQFKGFRGLISLNNIVNQAQLGFSAYHLGFTTADAMTSKLALAIEEGIHGVRTGDLSYVKKAIADGNPLSLFASPVKNAWKGWNVRKEWMSPGSTGNPELEKMVGWMKEAGAGVTLDPIYRTDVTRKMAEAFRQQRYFSAAFHAPFALNEKMANVIMKHVVPWQKIGVFSDLAEFEMGRLAQGATRDQVREVLSKAWDSVDNRMGQLRYDNLFWQKWAKDAAMATVRSVGWNLGTLREVGGGALVDTPKFFANLAQGKHAEFTHRMAYNISLPAVSMMLGGLIHYAFNKGNKLPNGTVDDGHPKEMKDWFFPRTGRKDEFGRDERVSLPTYMKDLVHYWNDPKGAAQGKVASNLFTIGEMMQNQDFYHTEITHADDPIYRKALDVAEYIGGKMIPFSVKNLAMQERTGAPMSEMAATEFGVTPAPSYIKKTKAESYMDEVLRSKARQQANTKENAERQMLRRDLERRIRTNQDPQKFAQQYLSEGRLTEDDLLTAQKRAGVAGSLERGFSGLGLEEAVKVYELANSGERSRIRGLLEQKLDRQYEKVMERMPPEKRKKLAQKILKLMAEPVTPPPPGK